MINSANVSFALCPLLTDGAIEALLTAGSDEQKQTFLPNMLSGKWTGSMNLTEPQAGSDLSLVRTRAEPQPDGTYKLFGTKIFITWGEHDMAENIVHLVLARARGRARGREGHLAVHRAEVPGQRRRLAGRAQRRALREHRAQDGHQGEPDLRAAVRRPRRRVGTLVGQENRGLEYMFIMMNAARFGVGVQGIAVAERSYQHAVGVRARPRAVAPGRRLDEHRRTIIHHPDVRRMLMTMRAYTEACRAMALVAASAFDAAHEHPDARCAPRTRRSTNSWCRWSRATPPR
jgi:alkylation response protein AidB-like acyl-CoA dehydrogenase